MNTKLISMFHSALKEPGAEKNFAKVNEVAMKYGYIIHPECCTKDVAAWLKEQSFNPNATFYKEWEDITSKTRFELLVDQILHYAHCFWKLWNWNFLYPSQKLPQRRQLSLES